MRKHATWVMLTLGLFGLGCNGPASSTAAVSDLAIGSIDASRWSQTYAQVIASSGAQSLLQSMRTGSSDLHGIAAKSSIDVLVLGGHTLAGLNKATSSATSVSGANNSLGEYWHSIDFDPGQPISNGEFQAALTQVAGLFANNGARSAQALHLSTADAALTAKKNAQAIEKVLVFGIVALSAQPGTRAGQLGLLDGTLPAGATQVNEVVDPDMWRTVSQSGQTIASGALGTAQNLIRMSDAARANNQQLFVYNAASPDQLERFGGAAPSSGPNPITINGNVNCTANCDIGTINYPNSGQPSSPPPPATAQPLSLPPMPQSP